MGWGDLCIVTFLVILIITPGCITPPKDPSNKSRSPDEIFPGSTPVVVTGTPTPLPPEAESLRQVAPYRTWGYPGSPSGPTPTVVRTEDPDPYVEIYNQTTAFSSGPIAYAYDLTSPPLIISIHIRPNQTTREIFFTNRSTGNKNRDEIIKLTGDSPGSWMLVTVRDRVTDSVVAEDGFGKIYSSERDIQIAVRTSGEYRIDFNGAEMVAAISMKVRKTPK